MSHQDWGSGGRKIMVEDQPVLHKVLYGKKKKKVGVLLRNRALALHVRGTELHTVKTDQKSY